MPTLGSPSATGHPLRWSLRPSIFSPTLRLRPHPSHLPRRRLTMARPPTLQNCTSQSQSTHQSASGRTTRPASTVLTPSPRPTRDSPRRPSRKHTTSQCTIIRPTRLVLPPHRPSRPAHSRTHLQNCFAHRHTLRQLRLRTSGRSVCSSSSFSRAARSRSKTRSSPGCR